MSMRVTPISPPRSVLTPLVRSALGLAGLTVAWPAQAADRHWNVFDGMWATQASWSPVGWPSVTDHIYIGSTPATVDAHARMDVGGTIAALDILGRARLSTQGERLRVNGPTVIDGANAGSDQDHFARLHVTNGADAEDFETTTLLLLPEGGLILDAGPTVQVNGGLILANGSYLKGNGTVRSTGNFVNGGEVAVDGGDLNIQVLGGASIDLDNSPNSEFIINEPGSDLTISAASVDDAFDGRIFLGGDSALSITAAGGWALGSQGSIDVAWQVSDGYLSRILGSPVTIGGEVLVNGTGNTLRIEAPATFPSSGLVHFHSDGDSRVELQNTATVSGATFDIRRDASVFFNGSTTIDAGQIILGQDADLRFNGATTVRGGTFSTFNALLGDGAVNFNGATTWDGSVTINGVARQKGNATVTGITEITADVFDMDVSPPNTWNIGQALTIDAGAVGVGSNGVNGDLNITGSINGRLTVNLDGPGESWTSSGVITLGPLAGATHLPVVRIAGSPVVLAGEVNIDTGRPRITAPVTIQNSAVVRVEAAAAELRLDAESSIASGATFEGAGTLVSGSAGAVTLAGGANTASVGLSNQGMLKIGTGPASASTHRFTSSGTWQVQIGGHVVGTQYDRLVVTNGPTQLGGQLQVRLIDSGAGVFVPAIGDEFTILTTLGGVNGTFAANPRSYLQGERYDWTVLYTANAVTLRLDAISQCAAGDLDDDGDIDLADLAVLLTNFGVAAGADWADGDLDGDGGVGLADLATLLTAFGSVCAG